MGRHATSISEAEKKRIAAALAAGVPLRHLANSGRFPGVGEKTMRAIANSAGVERRRCQRLSVAATKEED
jgi:hypothetical protein